ncbi:MAG: LysM peptidoglycan-binding domain-containing protein [Flexilinea sp.]|nr:LysM peptidoglycan-binding domain-containing protein [Flexilinea sp.]
MIRKKIGMISIILLLALCACSGKDKYEPFTPLSKQTVSPERESQIQAALNGNIVPEPTAEMLVLQPEAPVQVPSFDEDSFFAEVEPVSSVPTEAIPFEPEPPTATPVPPTETPLPTATKPYDPNITMYGTTNGQTTYTLQQGDDLVCLGRRFNISVPQLLSQNGIETPEEMGVGDTVLLPRSPEPWSMIDGYGRRILVLHPASYTIQSGDTLFSIACSYGDVRPEDIAVKNQLVLGESLPVGLTISIP